MEVTSEDLYRFMARVQSETERKCHEEWAAQENAYVRELTELRAQVKAMLEKQGKEVAT